MTITHPKYGTLRGRLQPGAAGEPPRLMLGEHVETSVDLAVLLADGFTIADATDNERAALAPWLKMGKA